MYQSQASNEKMSIKENNNDFRLNNKDLTIGSKKYGSLEMRNLDELYQNISVVGA